MEKYNPRSIDNLFQKAQQFPNNHSQHLISFFIPTKYKPITVTSPINFQTNRKPTHPLRNRKHKRQSNQALNQPNLHEQKETLKLKIKPLLNNKLSKPGMVLSATGKQLPKKLQQ
jgi:hypothetical protein